MNERKDTAWQARDLAQKYLKNIRQAIPLSDEQINVMCRVINADNHRIHRVLDIGCGDGILGAAVIEHHPGAHGVFMDFSETMIQAAQKRFDHNPTQHRFIQGDYAPKEWVDQVSSDAPFDAVVSGFSIHHQTDARKREIYGEIYDLLAPGGVFINVEHVSSPTQWVESRFDDRFIDSLYGHIHHREPTASRDEIAKAYYYRDDKQANILAPVEDQCSWLRNIGYQDVDCYFKLFELVVFGGRKL
jgi:ubiquinone/menaquinone biosynthesis C-methylase UbiE